MTIHVDVTQEDIRKGEPADCCKCPVALALLRAWPCRGVEVYGSHVVIAGLGTHYLPDEVKEFIDQFDDAAQRVSPFSFDLEVRDR